MSRPDERSSAPNRHARLIAATKQATTRDATAAGAVSLGLARRGGFVGPPRSVKPPLRHRVSKMDGKEAPTISANGPRAGGGERNGR